MIVLPMPLFCQPCDQSSALVLAHELAHLRRRDHWVRALELFVSIVYWWNPLVWVIRRQIHQAEDLCCDAWVRSGFPDCTKRYAEVLFETAESLRSSNVGVRRLLASPFLRIAEVRGTADTFAPGNLYLITGTYTLASHSRGKLSASITAMDAEHGRSTPLKVQSAVVNQGDGTFTLFPPMAHRGLPHVSFYPAEGGGEGFGGNYFGTGDSVLKRWWGSKE